MNGVQGCQQHEQGWRHVKKRLLPLLVFMVAGPWALPAAGAADVLAVGDPSRTYYEAFMKGFDEAGGPAGRHVVEVTNESVARLSKQELARFDAIVTIGSDAAQATMSLNTNVPMVNVLVSEDFADMLKERDTAIASPSTLVVMEQPVERFFELVQVSLPNRKRIGVIYGPQSYKQAPVVREQARARGYQLVEAQISTDTEIGLALQNMVGKIDVLLALPDQVVVNPNTAKSLILDSYLHEIALIGYSHALVKAGALMAVHSTPQQFGKQAYELVADEAAREEQHSTIQYPRYFRVAVNYQVARALGIDLPAEEVLVDRLHKLEVKQ